MKFLLAILTILTISIFVLFIGSIPYKGNVELFLHEVYAPYDCNSPVPKGYQLLSNSSEYTARTKGYYLVYYRFYTIGMEPQSFSDSCRCKAFIRYHYDQAVKENNYKKSFK